jgi:Bacterial antitoxin of type II TA system, VapB
MLGVGGFVPTNLSIDDRLIEEARMIGGHRTKKETVNAALEEYIRRRKQLDVLALFGTIDYDKKYHYKQTRQRGARA